MSWDRPLRPILKVACNEPGSGLFTGRASSLGIGNAELELVTLHEPRFVELDGSIRLAGKTWPIVTSKEWLGNWCWNGYLIGDQDGATGWWMVDFATLLRGRRLFRCTNGPDDFFCWFNGERELTPAEVHTALFETVNM